MYDVRSVIYDPYVVSCLLGQNIRLSVYFHFMYVFIYYAVYHSSLPLSFRSTPLIYHDPSYPTTSVIKYITPVPLPERLLHRNLISDFLHFHTQYSSKYLSHRGHRPSRHVSIAPPKLLTDHYPPHLPLLRLFAVLPVQNIPEHSVNRKRDSSYLGDLPKLVYSLS